MLNEKVGGCFTALFHIRLGGLYEQHELRTVGLGTGIQTRDIEHKKQDGSVFKRCAVLPQRIIRAYCWRLIIFVIRINKFFKQ
jgi:hypothetical protein